MTDPPDREPGSDRLALAYQFGVDVPLVVAPELPSEPVLPMASVPPVEPLLIAPEPFIEPMLPSVPEVEPWPCIEDEPVERPLRWACL